MVSLKKNSRVGGKLIANVDESVQKDGGVMTGTLEFDMDPNGYHAFRFNGLDALGFWNNRVFLGNTGSPVTIAANSTPKVRPGGSSEYDLWHSGNDGSGSGLHADLLDGKHANDFASSGHSHDAGDITSGTLNENRIPSIIQRTPQFHYKQRIDFLSGNDTDQLWLLCPVSGGTNEVCGVIYGQRSSGHFEAFKGEILISTPSSGSASEQAAAFVSHVIRGGRELDLITCDYNGTKYFAIRWYGGSYMASDAFFDGYIEGDSNILTNLKTSDVSNVSTVRPSNSHTRFHNDVEFSRNVRVSGEDVATKNESAPVVSSSQPSNGADMWYKEV